MKQTILDTLRTLGLPNSLVAQVTLGGRVLPADEFAARLAEGLEGACAEMVRQLEIEYICPDCLEHENQEPGDYCVHCKCDCDECGDCG